MVAAAAAAIAIIVAGDLPIRIGFKLQVA